MNGRLRIIVSGLIAQHPFLGGITWHYLQYVVGLSRLGHDVYYFEDSGEVPYNLDGGPSGSDWVAADCSENVRCLSTIMSRFGLEGRWAYRDPGKSQWFGIPDSRRQAVLDSADLLLNVSGTIEYPSHYRSIRRLAYIDTDPVVTHVKIANRMSSFVERVQAHDIHFSFGERLSNAIPPTEFHWRPTRQPIVLSEWQPLSESRETFTTIMNWTSYAPLQYGERCFRQKDVEFKRFLELPERVTPVRMEVALSRTKHRDWEGEDDDMPHQLRKLVRANQWTAHELLAHAGWLVADAHENGGDLDTYRNYIRTSKAEWSVAKNAYVQGQPGWFSERSACYLAAGRPVITQDTGFASVLPVGEGILAFRTLDEAVAAVREVSGHYDRHAVAARGIADAYFDSGRVLTRLIDEAMNSG